MPKSPDRNSQLGWPDSAFLARQTPPPAAKIQMRQWPCRQFGSIATAVARPPAM
jgi:hypothetical protein